MANAAAKQQPTFKQYEFKVENIDRLLSSVPFNERVEAIVIHNQKFINRMVERHAYFLSPDDKDDLRQELNLLLIIEAKLSDDMTFGEFTRRLYWKLFGLTKAYCRQTVHYARCHTSETEIDKLKQSSELEDDFLNTWCEIIAQYVCSQIRERLPSSKSQQTFDVMLTHLEKGGYFTAVHKAETGESLNPNTCLERRRLTRLKVKEMLMNAHFKESLRELLFARKL